MTIGWATVDAVDEQNPDVGDLRRTGTRLALLETREQRVAQGCTIALHWWRGEHFADRLRGVPYLAELLRKGVSEGTVREVLRRELLRVPGVVEVRSMRVSIDRATRLCTVRDVVVVTAFGAVQVPRLETS